MRRERTTTECRGTSDSVLPFIARVFLGAVIFARGAQKLFGCFGADGDSAFSMPARRPLGRARAAHIEVLSDGREYSRERRLAAVPLMPLG